MIKTVAEKLGKTYTPTGAAATRGDLAVRLAGLLYLKVRQVKAPGRSFPPGAQFL